MPLSFSTERACDDHFPHQRIPVLITGAGGMIGTSFARVAARHYDLRLMIHPDAAPGDLASHGEVVAVDLADVTALHRACQGIDTIVHLAGATDPSAGWAEVLTSNIIGTYNLFVAAKAARCRRVVYASSLHAVSGYPIDVQIKTTDPVNPGDIYGVSKCFGEALGRYIAEQEGLSVIAIRIGACVEPATLSAQQDPVGVLDTHIAPADLCDLLVRAIDDRTLRWALLHAVGDNRFKRLDISTSRDLLGFAPAADAFRLVHEVRAIDFDHHLLAHNAGDARQRSGMRVDLERLAETSLQPPPA